MAKTETIVILNQSRRLHTIGGVRILPTEAKAVPASVVESKAFKFCQERGELAVVEEERKPILDEDEARREADRRKKEGQGANNGGIVAKAGRARSTPQE